MIDIHNEQLLTMTAAGRVVRPQGTKPVAPSTVWRWHRRGVRGIRLETVVVGGTRYTSREALSRFVAATTEAQDVEPVDTEPKRSEAVSTRLARAGLLTG